MKVSLGLGLTNACNLTCAHCYRPDPPIAHLPASTVRSVCDSLDVAGVNLGTGENALHPDFHEVLAELLDRGLRVSLTSNGLSISALDDATLKRLHDVEVSIDLPAEVRFDDFRGPGAFRTAVGALERCAELGVRTTVLAVLMRSNHRDLGELAVLAASLGAPLRVNLYQPSKTDSFLPSYDEMWHAVRELLSTTTVLACSEPVICAAAGLPGDGLRCGRTSLRITPQGTLLPCVYWPTSAGTAQDVGRLGEALFEGHEFRALRTVPADCAACEWVAVCGGGCASRRVLTGVGLAGRDPFCPKIAGVDLRGLARTETVGDRLHTGNVCTLLVQA